MNLCILCISENIHLLKEHWCSSLKYWEPNFVWSSWCHQSQKIPIPRFIYYVYSLQAMLLIFAEWQLFIILVMLKLLDVHSWKILHFFMILTWCMKGALTSKGGCHNFIEIKLLKYFLFSILSTICPSTQEVQSCQNPATLHRIVIVPDPNISTSYFMFM